MTALRSAGLVLAAALLALGVGVGIVVRGGLAAEESRELVITVSGRGAVQAAPEGAVISAVAQGISATPEEARAREEEVYARMSAALAPVKGIALVPGSYGLHPRYEYDPEKGGPAVVGYVASRRVEVHVAQAGDVGEVLTRLRQAGVESVVEVGFTAFEPQELRRRAIAAALSDARGRAESVAAALRAQVAEVVDVDIATGGPAPVRGIAGEAARRFTPVPVEVNASVTVRYVLRFTAK